jgi:cytochrome c-type biogenesis protein CcmH
LPDKNPSPGLPGLSPAFGEQRSLAKDKKIPMINTKSLRRTISRLILAGSFIGLTLLFLKVQPGKAQDPIPPIISDDQVNAIAKQMYCPVCENTPLDVCPTQACAQWRELIREKLAAGWNENQIKNYFVEQYGARVLATPPARGFNWMIYLVPPIAIAAGLFILYRALRTWRQAPGAVLPPEIPDQTDTPLDEYLRRMEEELKKQN